MKKLLPYLRPYTKECAISPLFKLLEACFDLLVPLVIQSLIDAGIENKDKPYIWICCAVLAGLALVGLVCSFTAQFFAAKAAVGFSSDLRGALFAHVQGFSYDQTDRIGTSTLITRLTSDINQIQSGLNLTLRLLLRSPIIVFGAMIMAFTVDSKSAWIFAVVIPLLAVVVFTIMWITAPMYRKVQQKLDRVTAVTRENLSGVRVIRAFCREGGEIKRFEDVNSDHNRMQNLVGRISALMNPLTLLIVNGGLMALLITGAIRVGDGKIQTGAVVALTSYMTQILVELVKFATTIISLNKALASAHRVEAILDTPTGMEQAEAAERSAINGDNTIQLDHVSLTYSGNAEPSLSNVSLTVRRGETVGLIGSTGSGKTSLVNLITRFYDATEGQVYVNGQNVREIDPTVIREKIAVVPQKAVLFRGTVRSNLLWGNPNATDEMLWTALEAAQAKEFILEKEGGLDAPVEAGGQNFSGGQRQRLTIARALVRQADILILDDASSALDFATDAALRRRLRDLPNHPTVLIVSQRTASIRHADKILVLEDGEAVGCGSHEELLRACDVYREIHDSQFKRGGESQ